MDVLERFVRSLASTGWLQEREWSWAGEYGSATCPVCEERSHLWFTDQGGGFRFGCRNSCDRLEILHSLGMDGYDLVTTARPRWAGGKLERV